MPLRNGVFPHPWRRETQPNLRPGGHHRARQTWTARTRQRSSDHPNLGSLHVASPRRSLSHRSPQSRSSRAHRAADRASSSSIRRLRRRDRARDADQPQRGAGARRRGRLRGRAGEMRCRGPRVRCRPGRRFAMRRAATSRPVSSMRTSTTRKLRGSTAAPMPAMYAHAIPTTPWSRTSAITPSDSTARICARA